MIVHNITEAVTFSSLKLYLSFPIATFSRQVKGIIHLNVIFMSSFVPETGLPALFKRQGSVSFAAWVLRHLLRNMAPRCLTALTVVGRGADGIWPRRDLQRG